MAERFTLQHPAIGALLVDQDGVVARRQLIQAGASGKDVERLIRRRELTVAHRGILVNHSGPLTRRQREWVAVLSAWPAVLADESALPLRTVGGSITIAVAHGRKLVLPAGVTMRRTIDLEGRALWQRQPPRMRVDDALISVMIKRVRADEIAEAFAALAGVVGARATTADRVLERLDLRERVPHRQVIAAMITDARDGVCSVLERGYLQRVELPHGLPRGARQERSTATGGVTMQDVRYRDYGLVVELDGIIDHGSAAARDQDALRDLAELARADLVTARATYGVVFNHGCRAAVLVAAVLRSRGWTGRMRECPRCRA